MSGSKDSIMSQPSEQDLNRWVRFKQVAVEGAVQSTQRDPRLADQGRCAGTGSGDILLAGVQRWEEELGECAKLFFKKSNLGKSIEWIWGKKRRVKILPHRNPWYPQTLQSPLSDSLLG